MKIHPGGEEIIRLPTGTGPIPQGAGKVPVLLTAEQSYTARCEVDVDPLKTGNEITVTVPPRPYYPPTTFAAANAAALAEATAGAIGQLNCCVTNFGGHVRYPSIPQIVWEVTTGPTGGTRVITHNEMNSGPYTIITAFTSTSDRFEAATLTLNGYMFNTGNPYYLRYYIQCAYGIVTPSNVTQTLRVADTIIFTGQYTDVFPPTVNNYEYRGQVLVPTTCSSIQTSFGITSQFYANYPDPPSRTTSAQIVATLWRV